MKRLIFFSIISLMSLVGSMGKATAQMPLSPTAKASVLTCGPGDDFYTTFGHSALRICDTATGLDVVYNYGTFDFNTPHFYWKFMRGQLDYRLSRSSYAFFMREYSEEGREVREQVLQFSPMQVANLFLLMEQNYLPEYRYYRYDFFRDNCATRIRDMVYNAWAHDTLLTRTTSTNTYRRMVTDNLKGTLEWWSLGIDMLFGLPTDHRCSAPERMFLPNEMEAELAHCSTSVALPTPYITAPSKVINSASRQPLSHSFPPVVAFALVIVLFALLSLLERRHKFRVSPLNILDRTMFILAGVLGCFLFFMWFGTDHWCTKWNLNVLWASPLLILIAIRMWRSPRWALWLQEVCFLAAAVWVLWCGLSLAIFLLIILMAWRVAMLLSCKSGDEAHRH